MDLAKLEGWRQTISILAEHERKDRAEKLRQTLEGAPADDEEPGDFDAEDFGMAEATWMTDRTLMMCIQQPLKWPKTISTFCKRSSWRR